MSNVPRVPVPEVAVVKVRSSSLPFASRTSIETVASKTLAVPAKSDRARDAVAGERRLDEDLRRLLLDRGATDRRIDRRRPRRRSPRRGRRRSGSATRSTVGKPGERRHDLRDATEHRRAAAARRRSVPSRSTVATPSATRDVAQLTSPPGSRSRDRPWPPPPSARRAAPPSQPVPRPASRRSCAGPGSPCRRGGSRPRPTTRRRGRRPSRRWSSSRRSRRRPAPSQPAGRGARARAHRGRGASPRRHARIVHARCSEISRPPRARARPASGRRPART